MVPDVYARVKPQVQAETPGCRVRSILHGFHHAPDWSTVSLGCADCNYAEHWEDLTGPMCERRGRKLTPRAKATRARIEADIRERVRGKGCPHV